MGSWGAFGKMPGLGDFFRTGVAADFVAAWDSWLQATIVAGRAALGGAWEAAYMSAPLWRFALAPGVAGTSAVAGVLMPSVDRVGRQFPLTLACPVEGEAVALLAGSRAVWAAAEDLALDCLDDAMTREALEGRLAGLGVLKAAEARVQARGAAVLAEGQGIEGALAALAARPTAAGFACEVEGAGRLLLAPGLPGVDLAPALFDVSEVAQRGVLS